MKEKYLPIGTVVTLNDANKKIMIIGYLPMDKEGKIYDYNACTFPEGIISANQTLAFNHDKIKEINHLGLDNTEFKNLDIQIKDFKKNNLDNINQ